MIAPKNCLCSQRVIGWKETHNTERLTADSGAQHGQIKCIPQFLKCRPADLIPLEIFSLVMKSDSFVKESPWYAEQNGNLFITSAVEMTAFSGVDLVMSCYVLPTHRKQSTIYIENNR